MVVKLYRRRTKEVTFTIYAADGGLVAVTEGDAVRVKIGRAGAAPILELDSAAPSANGSTVARANPCNVRFDGADVTLIPPGTYDIEATIYESDDGEFRGTQPGILHVIDTMSGEEGAT